MLCMKLSNITNKGFLHLFIYSLFIVSSKKTAKNMLIIIKVKRESI